LSQEEKSEFVVSGMRCNHCAANVKNALLKVDGVKSVDVTLSDGHVIVYGRVKKLDILKSVEDLGFDIVSRDGE
jgi:copper chaperone CopZ